MSSRIVWKDLLQVITVPSFSKITIQPLQQSQLRQPATSLKRGGSAQFINLPSEDFTDKQPPHSLQTLALAEKTKLMFITNITNTKHEI